MSKAEENAQNLINFLQEREKELNCLYKIEEFLNNPDSKNEDVCPGIIEAIPPGWQYLI